MTSSVLAKTQDLLTQARRARQADRVQFFSLLTAAIKAPTVGTTREPTDTEAIDAVNGWIKKLRQGLEITPKIEATIDVCATYEKEINFCYEVLPKQLTDDELEALVQTAYDAVSSNPKLNIGIVLKEFRARNADKEGQYLPAKVAELVKQKLA